METQFQMDDVKTVATVPSANSAFSVWKHGWVRYETRCTHCSMLMPRPRMTCFRCKIGMPFIPQLLPGTPMYQVLRQINAMGVDRVGMCKRYFGKETCDCGCNLDK